MMLNYVYKHVYKSGIENWWLKSVTVINFVWKLVCSEYAIGVRAYLETYY